MNSGREGRASRHYCASAASCRMSFQHTRGDGAPKRKKCAYCGGTLTSVRGTWGVFVWTGDGRYGIDSAIELFAREAKAEAFALTDGRYVVRWIGE